MKRLKEGYYYLVNGDVVHIYLVRDEAWGIFGKYITGVRGGDLDSWDNANYPFIMSHDIDDRGFALTTDEVSKEDHPEYFL